jgi:hypothetical protein
MTPTGESNLRADPRDAGWTPASASDGPVWIDSEMTGGPCGIRLAAIDVSVTD